MRPLPNCGASSPLYAVDVSIVGTCTTEITVTEEQMRRELARDLERLRLELVHRDYATGDPWPEDSR